MLYILDAAAYISHARLDLSELSEVDYVCMSPHKLLGGNESTGVLIGKLDSYDNSFTPSFPGGGTVVMVRGYR